jgi:activator of HSP90 ATPase
VAIEFVVNALIPAAPGKVYDAWLNSEAHTAMTGSPAFITATVGVEFTAWDGYIHGRNLELVTGRRIVQSWRTTDFKEDEPDSRIEITLEPVGNQTKLTLRHSNLPAHGRKYQQGWFEAYFIPMEEYFSGAGLNHH